MNIGDKIQFIKTVREHCILKAKIGQTGVIKNIHNDNIEIELNNKDIIITKISFIKPYEKVNKFCIKTASNSELLERFEHDVAIEWQTTNTGTKSFKKLQEDIEKMRVELLKRLGK